jgi:hypothetical protein
MMFGLLLDNGALWELGSHIRDKAVAREALARHNYQHRIAAYCGDLAVPRKAVGLVYPRHRPQVAGGKARAAALSPERRREIARDAATARWARRST